jgi:lysophospholipase L1-like esterase
MKKISAALLITFSVILLSAYQQKNKKVVFFGDSITLAGGQPSGYIVRMGDSLKQKGITNYELKAAGVGYDKVYDLYLRMEDDVLSQHPDIVVIFEGVNDVGHKSGMHTGTDIEKYERFYRAIIKKLQQQNIKPVLCTMAVIGEKKNNANNDDKELDAYADIIRKIAKELNLPLVDFRTAFKNYYIANNPGDLDKNVLTRDGIHFNEKGHQFAADLIWEVLKTVK